MNKLKLLATVAFALVATNTLAEQTECPCWSQDAVTSALVALDLNPGLTTCNTDPVETTEHNRHTVLALAGPYGARVFMATTSEAGSACQLNVNKYVPATVATDTGGPVAITNAQAQRCADMVMDACRTFGKE